MQKVTDLFASPTIAPAPKKPAKKGKDRIEVEIPDMDLLAASKIVEKSIKGIMKQIEGEAKEFVTDQFADVMSERQIKPDSFTGKAQYSTALCSLAKRGSNLSVDEETAEELQGYGVPLDTVEVVPERFIINPDILDDQGILQAISEAVASHPKLEGVTVIMKQESEARYAVAEDTISQLARHVEDRAKLRYLMGKVGIIKIGRYEFPNLSAEGQKNKAVEILKAEGVL